MMQVSDSGTTQQRKAMHANLMCGAMVFSHEPSALLKHVMTTSSGSGSGSALMLGEQEGTTTGVPKAKTRGILKKWKKVSALLGSFKGKAKKSTSNSAADWQ
jgi:hypothetical protein